MGKIAGRVYSQFYLDHAIRGPYYEHVESGSLRDGRFYIVRYTIDRSQVSPTFQVLTPEEFYGDRETAEIMMGSET